MACFAFGVFKKTIPEFIPCATDNDIQAALEAKGMFDCQRLNARLSQKACAKNYTSAQAFTSSTNSEINSAYRKPCLGRKTGEKNAKVNDVKPRACKQCGRDLNVAMESRNRTGLCYSCRGNSGKKTAGKKRSVLREIAAA